MSSHWIAYTELTGPKWNYSPFEVLGFVTKGLLTPYPFKIRKSLSIRCSRHVFSLRLIQP